MNLIPPRLERAIRTQDSLMHAKDLNYLVAKGYIKSMRDTIGMDEVEVDNEELEKIKKEKPKERVPVTDTTKVEAIMPDGKKKAPRDSASLN